MGKLDTLYARAPVPLQNLMVSGYGVYWHWARFGRGFARLANEFGEREGFSQSEWARYQEEQFRRLVRVCAAEVPYYASLWTDAQKKSAALSDLQNLPLLEKKPLREIHSVSPPGFAPDSALQILHQRDDRHPGFLLFYA